MGAKPTPNEMLGLSYPLCSMLLDAAPEMALPRAGDSKEYLFAWGRRLPSLLSLGGLRLL
jgi:hypothetical protein